jgi:hypothetical protein
MRIVLILTAIFLTLPTKMLAQNDFKTLDKKTYDFFTTGDYTSLRKTADTMLLYGMDYYYLRIRLGILEYNKQLYYNALKDFAKAIEFNSLDTISSNYIYNSYLFSGRLPDAWLYLQSTSKAKTNSVQEVSAKSEPSEFFINSSVSGYDVILYNTNNLNYEAVKNSLSINAGYETYFSKRFRGTISYTNFHKNGTGYSPVDQSGKDLNFSQNQIFVKLTAFYFPGWEFSIFGHSAFYTEATVVGPMGNRRSVIQNNTEYLGGVGIAKNLSRIRTGLNASVSNFSSSRQIRGEGYFTWLPSGNLNLYLTSGWMGQNDINWGGTYQVSQEIGLKIFKSLWMESGLVKGNSFLYALNFGSMINNSFQIPATTIYTNLIVLAGKHLKFSIMPFYSKNNIYSWDLTTYSRTNKLNINSFGGLVKLKYIYR